MNDIPQGMDTEARFRSALFERITSLEQRTEILNLELAKNRQQHIETLKLAQRFLLQLTQARTRVADLEHRYGEPITVWPIEDIEPRESNNDSM